MRPRKQDDQQETYSTAGRTRSSDRARRAFHGSDHIRHPGWEQGTGRAPIRNRHFGGSRPSMPTERALALAVKAITYETGPSVLRFPPPHASLHLCSGNI